MRFSAAVLSGLVLAASVFAREPGFGEYRAVQESLRYLPPNIRSYYLEKAGFDMWPAARPQSESLELSLVGKWGGGPSVRVTGSDTIVYLARGSEVAVVDFADTANPRVLSYLQAPGLVAKSILVGNRLYVSSGYIETFDVSDPADPVKLGSVLARAPAIDVVDTLVYTLYEDSFKVFNFSNPANPQLLGACRDSGYDLSVCNGYAYIGDRWGLYVLDVTNPANPHRIAAWGTDIISVKARGNICCATLGNPNQPTDLRFYILDARNPASIAPLGSLDSCGGYEMCLADSLAFISGYYTGGHEFEILNIADSIQPLLVGTCLTPGDGLGVWTSAPLRRSFVADRLAGLTVIDVSVPTSPEVDTSMLTAGMSVDIAIQDNLACVANDAYGMVLLDVSVPSRPTQMGVLDSTMELVTLAVAVRDSFAYMGYGPSLGDLHTVDISDPTHPVSAGGVNLFNWPEDMVLRDSFVYIAEANRFQVVNVARPRDPVLVGSCVLPYDSYDMDLQDTLAYVANLLSLQIVDVSRPDSPHVVGAWLGNVDGVAVEDTVAYVTGNNYSVHALSIADPSSPYVLDSAYFGQIGTDVVVVGSFAYVSENVIHIVDVTDPRNLRLVGTSSVPYWTRRLYYSAPYLYACCAEGGVCVLETIPTGISDRGGAPLRREVLSVCPSVTGGPLTVAAPTFTASARLVVYDVTGKEVMRFRATARGLDGEGRWPVDLSCLPTGVYAVRLEDSGTNQTGKVIIMRR